MSARMRPRAASWPSAGGSEPADPPRQPGAPAYLCLEAQLQVWAPGGLGIQAAAQQQRQGAQQEPDARHHRASGALRTEKRARPAAPLSWGPSSARPTRTWRSSTALAAGVCDRRTGGEVGGAGARLPPHPPAQRLERLRSSASSAWCRLAPQERLGDVVI